MDVLKTWLEAGLGFLYPAVCQLCQREPASPDLGFVGEQCRRGVRRIELPYCRRCGLPAGGVVSIPYRCANCAGVALHFAWARSAVAAQGVVLDVIHRYKYVHETWFEPFLAGLLCAAAVPVLRGGRWHGLVPVPLDPVREREREFNQAERLCAHLSRATGIPVLGGVLRRVRATPPQASLGRQDRMRNAVGAFACRSRPGLRGARLVLVDDVLTTGATTSDCARALRQAGVFEVVVWTVARGL
jgi:ComF family protein